MDLYADPPGTPIETARSFTAALGGSSANIAAGLVRLGARASLLTCVSDDAVGRFALAELDRYGVDRSLVRTVGGEARNSLAVVDTMGAATQAVIYRNVAADFEMTKEDVSRADYAGYHAVVTTGTVLAAEPSRGAAFAALELAAGSGVTVVLDLDYRAYSWLSPEDAKETLARAADAATIVVGNDVEFGVLAGVKERGLGAARDLAAAGKLVVYKMGGAGAILLDREGETTFGVFHTKALKPTGAGDAFLAGFLTGLATRAPAGASVLRGAAAAAYVVARVGCAPAMPTTGELEEFIATHPGPTAGESHAHPTA